MGGALLVPALLVLGLLRPDDGSVPFFVLLALAGAGYLATLHQVATGLRPSGRALVVCAALALAWRVPMLLAPPKPAADIWYFPAIRSLTRTSRGLRGTCAATSGMPPSSVPASARTRWFRPIPRSRTCERTRPGR